MYASLLPWSKNLKEQDIWQFDFEKTALEALVELDEETIQKNLEASRTFWDRIDSQRKKATD
jgi:hypothetical protein